MFKIIGFGEKRVNDAGLWTTEKAGFCGAIGSANSPAPARWPSIPRTTFT
jgi:hypothetical protein